MKEKREIITLDPSAEGARHKVFAVVKAARLCGRVVEVVDDVGLLSFRAVVPVPRRVKQALAEESK